MELFSESDINAPALRAITRGLHTIALVDGLHDREVAFISELFRGRAAMPASDDPGDVPAAMFGSIEELTPLEPPALAALLPAAAHRALFLKAAYLLAWADGKVSFAERASIDAFASALGMGAEPLARLEAEVRDHVLSTRSSQDSSTIPSNLDYDGAGATD